MYGYMYSKDLGEWKSLDLIIIPVIRPNFLIIYFITNIYNTFMKKIIQLKHVHFAGRMRNLLSNLLFFTLLSHKCIQFYVKIKLLK